ncbi:DUF2971 domain-containing protein [Cupriavidus alkaliphilus]|uniref:DUF2971 domain-containing protein n=1 Tax=Cupriavidus alkaliphilus TaxID=942866 RepID=UPI00081592D4|nr:DUF2971 domain-containing protein [Cupriavidus alkaliphilus]SCB31632.1 Protein of unknown function [Cupriavidus alkaliphilus]
MQDYLYRFRSTHALLDGFRELENQEIYFCPPEGLNDPLEGFKHIFWRGDEIVWRNLLRHYLLNLMQATSLALIMGPEFNPEMCSPFVHQIDEDLPKAPIRECYTEACKEFFKHPVPERLIAALASRGREVRPNELHFYLRLLHPLATRSVKAALDARLPVGVSETRALDAVIDALAENLSGLLAIGEQSHGLADIMFSASEALSSQVSLINEFNNPIPDERRSSMFIGYDFTDFYVKSLERLLYPNWYVACFVADPTNSAMWGTYGDGHRGACLKFRAKVGHQDGRTLDLHRAYGWRTTSVGGEPILGYVPHRFEEVRYTSEFPQVNFFESIATLTKARLAGFWFAGPNGERSTTAQRMLREDEEWRHEYWRKYSHSFCTKSEEWAHEREARLVLHSGLLRFDDVASRKLRYRFSDLAGIAFGMKTRNEDKLQIMRLIDQKCVKEGRKDFEFYQARFSEQTKKIDLMPLRMLTSQ